MSPLPKDQSYGVLPWRQTDSGLEFLLIQHQKGHWDFPKGHLEAGEDPHQAAARELTEESGLTVTSWLDVPAQTINYVGEKDGVEVDKSVTFFLAEVAGEIRLEDQKTIDASWLSFDEALAKLTYQNSRDLLARAAKQLV